MRRSEFGLVFVKESDGITIRRVKTGLSDWNRHEITEGLEEGEEVLVFQTGRALEQAREFMERRRRSAMPGMRR